MYAAASTDDVNHERCRAILEDSNLEIVIPALVVAEASYLIGQRIGPYAEAAFLRALVDLEVEVPAPQDWEVIATLVEKYADFPLGATDASIAVLAERLQTSVIVTLDRRHFGALRTLSGGSFRLLPD